MKIPSAVVWQLTKRWNSHLVKFNGQQFTHDPLNATNLHNASQAGLSNDHAVNVSIRKEASRGHVVKKQVKRAGKGKRQVISLLQAHKSHNKIAKKKNNSSSKLLYSSVDLTKGINGIGKGIKGLTHVSERTRK